MLPSLRNYLKFIGLEEEFSKHGFLGKVFIRLSLQDQPLKVVI